MNDEMITLSPEEAKKIANKVNKEYERIVKLINTHADVLGGLIKLSEKYNFPIEDTPEILEEYILVDNEVLEQRNILSIVKTFYENERTSMGRNVLKQVIEAIEK